MARPLPVRRKPQITPYSDLDMVISNLKVALADAEAADVDHLTIGAIERALKYARLEFDARRAAQPHKYPEFV